jgi:glycosyltransferase involved in cell wall biosynthesis
MWRSAVRHLRDEGHDVRVLTTDYRAPGAPAHEDEDEAHVHRELRWYWRDHEFPRLTFRGRVALERANAATFRRHLREYAPDAVNWWAMGGMSLSLIEQARRASVPSVGVVVDDWMVYGPKVDQWQRALGRLPAPALRNVAERSTGVPAGLDLGAAGSWIFVSETVRSRALAAGWRLPETSVAHAGIESELFPIAAERPWEGRLLYLGRIDPRKGIDTAIRALGHLPGTTLTVLGGGDETHERDLRALAAESGLDGRVTFSRRPREQLAAAYGDADALLFPVRWAEPWGLVPLEAMSVGTPVVATGTGGSGEYLRDGDNSLVYSPPEDPSALAAAVARLAEDPELRSRLRAGGLATAARFDERSFNDAVKREVERVVAAR